MTTPLKTICQIIQSEMELGNDQVWIFDQKIPIPRDERLYVAVSVVSCKPFGNTRRTIATTSPLGIAEVQSVNMQALISIDILSRGTDARNRKEEVVMALNSTLSESLQESESFFIAPLPKGFVNLSEIDGTAIPYRFNISVQVQYFVTKQKQIAYYDTFDDDLIIEG